MKAFQESAFLDLYFTMATVVRGGRWASDGNSGDDAEAEPDHTTSVDTVAKAVLAVVLQRNHLGVAVYNEEESEILWAQCVR